MDPLSIAAAAAGFLATLETITNKLREVSRKLRDSTTVKATLELGQQLMQLEFVTRSLLDREIPTLGGSSNASAINVVQQIKLNIQSCEKDLEELSSLLDQLDNSLKEKVIWVFKNHEKAMDLCESLNRHYNSLDLSLSTILILTTHQTRVAADQTLQEAERIKDQVNITREAVQDVKGDTTHLKRSVEQVGQSVDQMGYDVSEMLTLLRKFDQHKSWPFRGHGGFVTTDLCFTLERYFRDQSGIDTEELRSQFSGFQTEDDLASLRSGWTWGGSKQSAPDTTSRSRYGSSQSPDSGPVSKSSMRQSAGERSHQMNPSQAHITSQSVHGVNTPLVESSIGESAFENAYDEAAGSGSQQDPPRISIRVEDPRNDLQPGPENSETLEQEPSDTDTDVNEGSVSTASVLDSQSQITTPSVSGLSAKAIPNPTSLPVQAQQEVTARDNPALAKLRDSLQALWNELASDEARGLIQHLRSEVAIQQAQNARKNLPSRLAQRRLYQELHQASGRSGSPLEEIKGLLERGANPNLPIGQIARFRQFHNTRTGYAPPLYLAISNKNIPALRCLLEYGAEPDCHLVEETPLEKLLAEAKSDPSGSEAIITMALILASNGAKITPLILSRAISLDGVAENCTFLVMRLLLESGPNAIRQLDLQTDVLAKDEASRIDELLVEAVLPTSLQPSCANICSAIRLRSPKIISLLLDSFVRPVSLPMCLETAVSCGDEMAVELLIAQGSQPNCSSICLAISLDSPKIVRLLMDGIQCPQSLPVCMEKALSCWNEMAIELLMARGTPPPLEAIYRAIELRKPGLFATFVKKYCNEGSRPLNLQRCLSKAIAHWNDHDSTIVQSIISRGAKPTEEQMTTIIEHDDLETIDVLLALGTDVSDFRFSCASADLACRILRSSAKSNIRAETKQEKLLVALSEILRPPRGVEQGTSRPEDLASEGSSIDHSIKQPKGHWSRQSTLFLIRLLMQEKVCPDGEILLSILTSKSLDTDLALIVISEMEEISHGVCLDIVQYGETDRVEFLLNAGISFVDVPFLLDAALETSSYWQGKCPSFRYNHLPCLDGAPMPLAYEAADHGIREKMREKAEGMCLLIFNYWLRASPTPLRQRALEFLVQKMPGETQRQVISRCKHHPTLSTIQLLLQYSAIADSPLLLSQALAACVSVLDNEALGERELASWSELLVICLGLRFSVPLSEAMELKYQCLELILCHMEEKEMDINDSFAVDLRSPFNTIFANCPPEELPTAIELFCKYGADANRPPMDERSDLPLIVAAEKSQSKAIPIMVEFGGDLLNALREAVTEGNIRAMRGGLIEESINMEILSKNTAFFDTTSSSGFEPELNVMDLFGIAIKTRNVEILDTLFDSGLQYSIDRDLEFLGSVADYYFNNQAIPEWAQPSYDLEDFCGWCAGVPRSHHQGPDRQPLRPLYLNKSLILELINRGLIRDSGAMLSCLLKRGSCGAVNPHPSTEYLLFKALGNLGIFLQLLDLKIPLRTRTWNKLEPAFEKYLWEHYKWALRDPTLANECLYGYISKSGNQMLQNSDVLAFFLHNATRAERGLTSMSFLDKVFDDFQAAEDRIKILCAIFEAIGRLRPMAAPQFQFCILAYSHESPFSQAPRYPAFEVDAAAAIADINMTSAALLYAADSNHWDVVRHMLTESNYDIGSRLEFDELRPSPRKGSCRHFKRRNYFCQCTQVLRCNEDAIEPGYRGQPVLFHAVQDGVVDIVQMAIREGVDLNRLYGHTSTTSVHTGIIQYLPSSANSSGHDDRVNGNGQSHGSTVTLLHLAVFCCVDGPVREDRLEILKLLVQNGANVHSKALVPNRFLKISSRSTMPFVIAGSAERKTSDAACLNVEEFARAMEIPEERQDKGLVAWRRKSKGPSLGLRETILEVLQGVEGYQGVDAG